MIERWKDTAFGSDFGGDFLELVEEIASPRLDLELIFTRLDLKRYLENPELLESRTDNNVKFLNTEHERYIHFEDAIIALAAIMAAGRLTGRVDLTGAYGEKNIECDFTREDARLIHSALRKIHDEPDKYVLFEMCGEAEREETLNDIGEILDELENLLREPAPP